MQIRIGISKINYKKVCEYIRFTHNSIVIQFVAREAWVGSWKGRALSYWSLTVSGAR